MTPFSPRGPSSADEDRAVAVLGREHALVRALAYRRTFALQLLATSIPLALGAVGIGRHVAAAPAVLEAASVVAATLVVAFLISRGLVREQAQELIAGGERGDALPVVANERRRLLSGKERESLAHSLESALDAAEHWHEILPASRPPHGVRCLRFTAQEIREIVSLLRSEAPDVRGVALTARFLAGGYGASLYRGDVVALREELNRIRYLLAASTDADRNSARLAA